MKEKINEEFLCVLRKDKLTDQIEVDYVKIEVSFSKIIDKFSKLCDKSNSTLEQVMDFIKTTEELNQLTSHYRYCVSLHGAYQAFTANNQDTVAEIISRQQLMLLHQKEDEYYDINKAIAEYKEQIKSRYILWSKAYSINKAYRLCHEDKSILTFSHRIDGWSNPVYQLTTNFSVEIKTNFGYGNASYFYTKLKYKNIDITPLSDWVYYEIAQFSEIVRYTQSYLLRNEYWLDAMVFSRDACNLSMESEELFVEKYIIDECENMVKGLEEIFSNDHFSFKNREKIQYSVDKKGHVLVEFRGEKISGALDFISKILEYESIASVKSFIKRIEACNRKIQPILVDEAKILKGKISDLKKEINALKPKHDKVVEENTLYNKKKIELQKEMVSKGQLNVRLIDTVMLDKEFNVKYPKYTEFLKEYKSVTESFRMMTEQLQNLTRVYENIISYNDKITQHFGS